MGISQPGCLLHGGTAIALSQEEWMGTKTVPSSTKGLR